MKKNSQRPPKISRWLLKTVLPFYAGPNAIGDYEEIFRRIAEEDRFKANLWFLGQILRSVLPFMVSSIYWRIVMFKNYLKIAFRHLFRHKVFSFLNVAGLAVGMAASFVILNYVMYETGYDKYHKKRDRIYRVVDEVKGFGVIEPQTPMILAPTLIAEFPEVENVARIVKLRRTKIKQGDTWNPLNYVQAIDPQLFAIFTIELIEGDSKAILNDPFSVLLSERMASTYFPNQYAIGKTITIRNRSGVYDLNVTGIYKDLPERSTFRADCLTSLLLGEKCIGSYFPPNLRNNMSLDWRLSFFTTYMLLKKDGSSSDLEKKLIDFSKKYEVRSRPLLYMLQPMSDIYFHSTHLTNNFLPEGSINDVYLFSAIAVLILLMACINFIILTTARSSVRTKEIGLRKVIGATRFHLIKQIMMESILLSFIALPLAMFLTRTFLPILNKYLGKQLTLNYFQNHSFSLLLILITILLGILSGSYTSLYLSKFQPVDILKARLSGSVAKSYFRKGLIVFQLIIFISLMTATIIIYRQMEYSKKIDMGFNSDRLMTIDLPDEETRSKYHSFKNEIKEHIGVLNVSAASVVPPTESSTQFGFPKPDGSGEFVSMELVQADYGFIETMEFELLEGRTFSKTYTNDGETGMIVNETALKELGIKDPLNTTLPFDNRIIGVVKNFYLHSLHKKIPPIYFRLTDKSFQQIVIRIKPGNVSDTIEFIDEKWKEFNPDIPFQFGFVGDRFEELYKSDLNFGKIMQRFTFLAIVVACLGLFGLSLFIAEQRTHEIGIRKVLGASVPNVIGLLSKELILLVVIASIISVPIVWFGMAKWLQEFAYKINIGIGIFVLSVLLGILISWLTICFQTVKAALTDPVKVLRYE